MCLFVIHKQFQEYWNALKFFYVSKLQLLQALVRSAICVGQEEDAQTGPYLRLCENTAQSSPPLCAICSLSIHGTASAWGRLCQSYRRSFHRARSKMLVALSAPACGGVANEDRVLQFARVQDLHRALRLGPEDILAPTMTTGFGPYPGSSGSGSGSRGPSSGSGSSCDSDASCGSGSGPVSALVR